MMSKKSTILRIRPRFEFPMDFSQKDALEEISKHLDKSANQVEGVLVDNHVILDIPEKYRHFWSPQMNFRFTKNEDDKPGTLVKGIIGPRPATWTLFMFFYFAIGVIGFFISSYGISKWSLGDFSYTIWAFPISLMLMATAYIAGKMGERLGRDQVETLTKFVNDALKFSKND